MERRRAHAVGVPALSVEDEPMIRMLLEDMLGELGYTVAAEAAHIDEATRIRLACVVGVSVAIHHPSAGTGSV
jgi:hypothetical protein